MCMNNTKAARIESRYVPVGAVENRNDEARTVAYLFTNAQDRPAALGYAGTSGKPAFHFRFATDERRQAFLAEWVERELAKVSVRAQAKAKRQTAAHGLVLGDVLYTSWGYDQTNVDFYEVINVRTSKTVHVRKLRQTTTETGFMSGNTQPIAGEFSGEKVFVCRATGERSVTVDGRPGRWWDGRPLSCSWYA